MKELARILGRDDIKQLNAAENKPLLLCNMLSQCIRPLLHKGTQAERWVWDRSETLIDDLGRVVSKTEQLSSTPVPLSYRRHASRFLSIWTLTAPLFLVPQCGPLLAVVSHPLMCWALFGSEEAGKIIEEPFGTTREYGPAVRQVTDTGMLSTENLPLLRYCEQIKRDIEDIEMIWANLETTTPQCTLPIESQCALDDPDCGMIEVMGSARTEMRGRNQPFSQPLPIIPGLTDSSDNYSV